MRRAAFPPSPLPASLPELTAHPGLTLAVFALLSLSVGMAWTLRQLLPAVAGCLLWLLWPGPRFSAWPSLRPFLPLLLLVPLFHIMDWVGFALADPLPWRYAPEGWGRGLQLALRLGLWILISARSLERLHPAALLARLPRQPRLARRLLAPLLALSWLELSLREAWLLERAWRSRGGAGRGLARRAMHWPSLLLPLFRNLLARGDTLAAALAIRRFPTRWAGAPRQGASLSDLLSALAALALLLLTLWIRRTGA